MTGFIPHQIYRNQIQMHRRRTGPDAERRHGRGSPQSVFKQSEIQFWRCGRCFEICSMCCANMLLNRSRYVRARARPLLLQETAKEGPERREQRKILRSESSSSACLSLTPNEGQMLRGGTTQTWARFICGAVRGDLRTATGEEMSSTRPGHV